jgi:hypothetical protein
VSPLALLVGFLQLLTAQAGATPTLEREVASEKARDAAVERLVAAEVPEPGELVRYQYNFVDLNADGTPEVLLRIDGRSTCVSGGCRLLVLSKAGSGYEVISRTTLTWAPILVSEHRTNGWNDLVLWQRADPPGGASHYKVLEFEGRAYPQDPSMEPAHLLELPVRGVAYLSERLSPGIEYRR